MDHKTTASSTKPRPWEPLISTRPGGNGPTAPGRPRASGCSDPHQQAPKAELPARNASRRLFRRDEEPATPIAGYHGTRRTPPGPWAPTWVRRAPNPAVVAVQSCIWGNPQTGGRRVLLQHKDGHRQPPRPSQRVRHRTRPRRHGRPAPRASPRAAGGRAGPAGARYATSGGPHTKADARLLRSARRGEPPRAGHDAQIRPHDPKARSGTTSRAPNGAAEAPVPKLAPGTSGPSTAPHGGTRADAPWCPSTTNQSRTRRSAAFTRPRSPARVQRHTSRPPNGQPARRATRSSFQKKTR